MCDLADVHVIVFEPHTAPEGQIAAKQREVPKMTAGRAALVVLMHRYLAGLMDPFVTLLEVHKLMYFMQLAGQPMRLRFAKEPFGPYAENLRHVLRDVEGHLLSGYANGGDAPRKQLELIPGAVSDADAFLKDSESHSRPVEPRRRSRRGLRDTVRSRIIVYGPLGGDSGRRDRAGQSHRPNL